jgi:hypothetical protein
MSEFAKGRRVGASVEWHLVMTELPNGQGFTNCRTRVAPPFAEETDDTAPPCPVCFPPP